MDARSLYEDLHHVLSTRYPVDGANMTMSEWIEKNTHMAGAPFSFKGYEFQRQIADDMHPDLACIKCSQVGLTETQIRKFLGWLKRNRGTTGIFTLPSEKLFKRISKMRIKPLIESESVFNQRPVTDGKPSRSMDMYQIDESFAVISGLTEDDATSTSADILFHDEVDLSDQEMLALAQSRLQNSDFKITQGFSTPKYPGYGIDGKWQESDQWEYLLRCTACRHHQIPTFETKFLCLPGYKGPESPIEASAEEIQQITWDGAYLKCEKCSKPLDLRDPSLREWVARHPAKDLIRGYRVRPFSTHRLPIKYIFTRLLTARRMTGIAGFYWTVLGEPYVDSKAQLSEAEIRAVLGAPREMDVGPDVPCAIGIDVGDTCHIVVGPIGQGVAVMRAVPEAQLKQTLVQLFERYNIVAGLIDRHPYTPTANSLRDFFTGRILPCEYRGSAALNLVKNELNEVTHCQVNRTDVLDAVVDTIRGGNFEINGYGAQESVFIEHLRNMVREEEPEQPAKWVKLNTNDHFFHAMAFMLAAPRAHELMHEYYNDQMSTSFGIFDLEDFAMNAARPHPDFAPVQHAPLSTRARMKQGNLSPWL